jgi:predicted amidophosphoribosyltransferase
LRRAVQGLKYGRRHALRRLLTALFLDGLTRHGVASAGLNAVVSVPCHGATLRERGLDLPALLSRAAAETLGVPWRPQALERRDPSVHLAGLSLRERRRAVRGLYGVRQSLSGAILLVDDVVTSTSTVRAAAKACLAAGAERVFVQALARTPTHPQK